MRVGCSHGQAVGRAVGRARAHACADAGARRPTACHRERRGGVAGDRPSRTSRHERRAHRTHAGSPMTSSNAEPQRRPVVDGELGVAAAVLAQALARAVVLEPVGLDRQPQLLAAEVDDGVQPGLGDLQLRGELEALLDGQGAQHGLERVGRPTVGVGRHPSGLRGEPVPRRAAAASTSVGTVTSPRPQGGVGHGQCLVEREDPGAVEHRAQRGRDAVTHVVARKVGPARDDSGELRPA